MGESDRLLRRSSSSKLMTNRRRKTAVTGYRASACGIHMLLSQIFNATGLALDIIGFTILFALALPAVMRRNFVSSDRVDPDGVRVNSDQAARLLDPESAKRLESGRANDRHVATGLAV